MRPSKSAIISRDFFGLGSEKIEVRLISGLQNQTKETDHRVLLEPLTGKEEESIFWNTRDWCLPKWVNLLLSQKVYLHGQPLGEEKTGQLSVVDRDLLFLYLRMLTFGTELWGITHCPQKACHAKLDFTFDLSSLSIPKAKQTSFVSSASALWEFGEIPFKYREPNGLDQIVIADLMTTNPHAAWLTLLSQCIIQWDQQTGITANDLIQLPAIILDQVDAIISDNMNTLDRDIAFTCAHCNRKFVKTLDIQAFFWEELRFASANFQEEVHYLAFFYHWSEQDILNLTRWKRKLYLNFIKKQVNA